jgi:hypothetical protein
VAKLEGMMRAAFLVFLSIGAASCQREAPAPSVPMPPGRQPFGTGQPVPAPAITLTGEWRVAAIDGAALDEPVGIALTGDEARLWWAPVCAGMSRTYSIRGNIVAFGSTRPALPPGSATPLVCAIGLPPRLADVFRALDAADRIVRTPENGILIEGEGRSVTLFSQ